MPSDQDNSSSSGSGRNNPNVTTTTVITRRVEPGPPQELASNAVASTKQEWTTCKRVVNHKTKQVETRVQRQLVYEDGRIIADSGPQITTKMTEDNRTEETENSGHKNLGDDPGHEAIPGVPRVVSEKTETHQVMKESKEENMQLHNETFHELTGPEFHQKALMAPENSLFIAAEDEDQPYPGKVVHYSCRSQKVTDKEEVKEVSELKDGEIITETTKTHHHEEQEDDEVPEDEVDEAALPEVSKETTRNIEYYKDDDAFDSLSEKMRRKRENNFFRDHSPSRRDPVTKKTLNLDEEEVIRNSETNRWLENHFGSESESDVEEITKTTKAGGNVIKIQMTGSPRPTSQDKFRIEHKDTRDLEASKSRRRFEGNDIASHSRVFQDQRLCANSISEVKDWHSEQKRVSSPLPRSASPSNRPESTRSPPVSGISAKQTDTVHRQTVPSPSKSPSKTYYLGDDNTYKRNHTKLENISLKRQSDGWKSTPSIRDDYYRSVKDEEKQKTHKQKVVRHEDKSPERFVHRSHSQKDTPRSFTVYDGSKTSKETYFIGEDAPVSQTLPKDTRFKGEEKKYRKNYNTIEVQMKHKNQAKSDLSVQVDLSDEESKSSTFPRKHSTSPFRKSNDSRRRSPSPVRVSNGSRRISPSADYISNDRTSKSLPRFSGKKLSSKEKEEKVHTSLNNSTSKTPAQTFYFGDENDAYYKTTKKKTLEGNQDAKLYGIEHRYSNKQSFNPNDHSFVSDCSSSPSYREGFFTIERDSGVTRRHSNLHRSMGDLRESSMHDFARNADETQWSSRSHKKKTKGHSSGISKVEEGSFRNHSDSYESNSFLNDKKSYYKNTHSSNIDISVTPNKKHSGSEMKRHQFMQNLLGSSERDLTLWTDESDVYKNSTNRRQRTSRDMPPPLPKHLDSSTPPSSPIPHMVKINQSGNYETSSTSSPPDSPSRTYFHTTSHQVDDSLFATHKYTPDSKSSGYSSRISRHSPVSGSSIQLSSFSPLSSHLEIKNASSHKTNDQAHWSKRHTSTTSGVSVWENR
ncbi:uncharacterized protein LOC143253925 isoform X2 [Tachypleus tridentatus]|uniref:uncharacterized protein LOC143253925 isoform X2 n=1 Tax=Tachypleus tridentatus TaxID=6853 RepID=UPI003FD6A8F4